MMVVHINHWHDVIRALPSTVDGNQDQASMNYTTTITTKKSYVEEAIKTIHELTVFSLRRCQKQSRE